MEENVDFNLSSDDDENSEKKVKEEGSVEELAGNKIIDDADQSKINNSNSENIDCDNNNEKKITAVEAEGKENLKTHIDPITKEISYITQEEEIKMEEKAQEEDSYANEDFEDAKDNNNDNTNNNNNNITSPKATNNEYGDDFEEESPVKKKNTDDNVATQINDLKVQLADMVKENINLEQSLINEDIVHKEKISNLQKRFRSIKKCIDDPSDLSNPLMASLQKKANHQNLKTNLKNAVVDFNKKEQELTVSISELTEKIEEGNEQLAKRADDEAANTVEAMEEILYDLSKN